MKTTVDIPEKEMKELMKYTKARTKKEAILEAVRDFNRRQKLKKLADMLGTFEDIITLEELEKMREDHKWPGRD
jgi:hypothetical protein